MDKKQRKALEAKAKKKIKAIMRQYPLFSDTAITITFKPNGIDTVRPNLDLSNTTDYRT